MEWQSIETAPKDQLIFGLDIKNHYSGKLIFIDNEWECIDWKGYRMQVGFYPTHYILLPQPPNDTKGE